MKKKITMMLIMTKNIHCIQYKKEPPKKTNLKYAIIAVSKGIVR